MARRKLWRRPNAIDDDPYRNFVLWNLRQKDILRTTVPEQYVKSDAAIHWQKLREEHFAYGQRTQKRPKQDTHTKSYKEYIRSLSRINGPIETAADLERIQRTPLHEFPSVYGRKHEYTPQGQKERLQPALDYWKDRHKDSVKEYKKWNKIIARGGTIPISPQLRKTDQRWRVTSHGGKFSQLGPMGPFTENVIIEIELLAGLNEVLSLMFRSINSVQMEIRFMSAIEDRIIKPIVREGIEQIVKLVPMMSGTLRETMIDSLRAYVNFEGGAKRFAKVSIDTFGVNYARPVNKMPNESLKHTNKFRKKGSRMYYLQDPDAETDFFGTIVENLRVFAKEKYESFISNYVLPRLAGHRPFTRAEKNNDTPEAMNTYGGFQESYTYENNEGTMNEMSATREADFDIMKGVDNLLSSLIMGGDSRITRTQKKFVKDMLAKAGRRGDKGFSSIQFAKLLFKVKFYGGTYK
jgi:hypothetical protein